MSDDDRSYHTRSFGWDSAVLERCSPMSFPQNRADSGSDRSSLPVRRNTLATNSHVPPRRITSSRDV